MFGAFSQFWFRSTKFVQNQAVLETSGAKQVGVEFYEMNAPNLHRLTQNSGLVHFRSSDFGRQNSCKTTL
jgi:hypothetical protein